MAAVLSPPAKAGAQGSGDRCFAAAWTPAFAGRLEGACIR